MRYLTPAKFLWYMNLRDEGIKTPPVSEEKRGESIFSLRKISCLFSYTFLFYYPFKFLFQL